MTNNKTLHKNGARTPEQKSTARPCSLGCPGQTRKIKASSLREPTRDHIGHGPVASSSECRWGLFCLGYREARKSLIPRVVSGYPKNEWDSSSILKEEVTICRKLKRHKPHWLMPRESHPNIGGRYPKQIEKETFSQNTGAAAIT